jgi:hypothetical protein
MGIGNGLGTRQQGKWSHGIEVGSVPPAGRDFIRGSAVIAGERGVHYSIPACAVLTIEVERHGFLDPDHVR